MTTILDIDIDLFLNEVAYNKRDNLNRLDGEEYKSDSIASVEEFLENRCLLSKAKPSRGLAVTFHEDVFRAVEDLVANEKLLPPFHWIHADAHDDLNGPPDKLPPVNSGNFMLHLLSRGLLSQLTFVQHPSDTSLMHCSSDGRRIEHCGNSVPFVVHLKQIDPSNWRHKAFYSELQLTVPPDFVFITQSPSFTPESADVLFDLCKQYICGSTKG